MRDAQPASSYGGLQLRPQQVDRWKSGWCGSTIAESLGCFVAPHGSLHAAIAVLFSSGCWRMGWQSFCGSVWPAGPRTMANCHSSHQSSTHYRRTNDLKIQQYSCWFNSIPFAVASSDREGLAGSTASAVELELGGRPRQRTRGVDPSYASVGRGYPDPACVCFPTHSRVTAVPCMPPFSARRNYAIMSRTRSRWYIMDLPNVCIMRTVKSRRAVRRHTP